MANDIGMAKQISSSKSSGVVFRRIGGRIVPIHVSINPQQKKSAALAGAGVVTAVAAGAAAATVVKSAATKRLQAKGMFRIANLALRDVKKGGQRAFDFVGNVARAKYLRRSAVELRGSSMALRHLRRPTLVAGTAAAGFLIGKGIQKGLEGKHERLGIPAEAVTQVAGQVAAVTALGVYYKRLGLGLPSVAKYAKHAMAGTTHLLARIPIKTKFGTLRF